MSRNPAASYGRDIRCLTDADELFTEVEGVELVRQDALHRLMTDNILGDDGTGTESHVIVGWGFDVRRLLGMSASKLAAHQPILAEVLMRDERIETADVVLTKTTTNGLDDVALSVNGTTALGPFSIVRNVSEMGVEP